MLRRLGEAAAAAFVVGRSRHYASAGEELHQSADRVLCWRSMERFLGERQGGEGARREAERSRVAFEGRGGTRIRRPKQVKAPSRPSIQCRGSSSASPSLSRCCLRRCARDGSPSHDPVPLAALSHERGSLGIAATNPTGGVPDFRAPSSSTLSDYWPNATPTPHPQSQLELAPLLAAIGANTRGLTA